jgi:hypothetical protein
MAEVLSKLQTRHRSRKTASNRQFELCKSCTGASKGLVSDVVDVFEVLGATHRGWRRSYLLFAVFLAFAALFQVQAIPALWGGKDLVATGLALAVVLAAVVVLCAPGQPRGLLLLSSVQLASAAADLRAGTLSDVQLLIGFVHLIVALGIVRQGVRRRGRSLDAAAIMAELAPVLRLGTAFVYGFVFLSKVKNGWPQPALMTFMTPTLVLGGLAPLLLLLPITRSWAALGLVVFQALWGLNAVHDQPLGVSATLFALLLTALSPAQMESATANKVIRWVLRWLAPAGATLWPPLLFVVIVAQDRATAAFLFVAGRYCAFLIYSLILVTIFARVTWPGNRSAPL